MTAHEYRVKAAELVVRARQEMHSSVFSEFVRLAGSYMRLAQQAELRKEGDATVDKTQST
jgi:hypothetical protein